MTNRVSPVSYTHLDVYKRQVVVRLEIYGVVVVRAILKFDLVRCGSRAETCVRVCKVDPAACNNCLLYTSSKISDARRDG